MPFYIHKGRLKRLCTGDSREDQPICVADINEGQEGLHNLDKSNGTGDKPFLRLNHRMHRRQQLVYGKRESRVSLSRKET